MLLKNAFPTELSLDGLRIAVDCAHGATYRVAPSVFGELGAEIRLIGAKPNGTNINSGVGSLFPERLARLVKAGHADLGVAFDGDGDRSSWWMTRASWLTATRSWPSAPTR